MKAWSNVAGLGILSIGLISQTGCSTCCGRVAKGDADCPSGVCASGSVSAKVDAAKPEAKGYAEIDTEALAALLAGGAQPVLLDARTGKWDDGRRLPGAKSLSADTDEAGALAVIGGKETLVVTYCTNLKCPASKHLANRLLALGFRNVMKYPQGIDEWEAKGHKVVSVK